MVIIYSILFVSGNLKNAFLKVIHFKVAEIKSKI